MARQTLTDPGLRPLVERLVILFLLTGSVNRVQQELNRVLAEDPSQKWLYPNRLHTLMSDDPSRAVNSETVDTLGLALSRLDTAMDLAEARRHRELFERQVLVEPSFEQPLLIPRLDWSDPDNLRDLADYVLNRAEVEFSKTLVVASRVEHVGAIHNALLEQLQLRADHILTPDEVGFVHGSGSSTGTRPDEFLDEFTSLPRGILVTTAQLLGEGFDDSSVNAVVMTYATSSMVQLMQAAGRCLRCALGKERAYVVQAKESALAYHYEQRWLYQDISDLLHPRLIDRAYASLADLASQIDGLLSERNVDTPVRINLLEILNSLKEGDTCSVLFTGLPYDGDPEKFGTNSPWSAVIVTPTTRDLFLRVFNDFSVRLADVKQPQDFLRHYLEVNPRPGSVWTCFRDMLTAMEYARRELLGEYYVGDANRGYLPNKGTTWLTYVTFRYGPTIPQALEAFLADAVNREDIIAQYSTARDRWAACVKIDLPLGATLAFLLEQLQVDWLKQERDRLIQQLRSAPPSDGFSELASWQATLPSCALPLMMVQRFEAFLPEPSFVEHVHELQREQAAPLA